LILLIKMLAGTYFGEGLGWYNIAQGGML